jgi:hypothetical protein
LFRSSIAESPSESDVNPTSVLDDPVSVDEEIESLPDPIKPCLPVGTDQMSRLEVFEIKLPVTIVTCTSITPFTQIMFFFDFG